MLKTAVMLKTGIVMKTTAMRRRETEGCFFGSRRRDGQVGGFDIMIGGPIPPQGQVPSHGEEIYAYKYFLRSKLTLIKAEKKFKN